MKPEIAEKYPKHCRNNEEIKFKMIMSPDNDSYISCKLMEFLHGYETLFFYSYDKLYIHESADIRAITYDELLGIDLDLIYKNEEGKYIKCWGNHLTAMSEFDQMNDQCANLNNIVGATRTKNNRFTYSAEKRAISTAIQIASYYKIFHENDGTPRDIPEAVKMYFWATDAMFKAGYTFKHMAAKFIEELDIYHISDVLEKDIDDFYHFIRRYNLSGRIWINDEGYMQTNIRLEEIQEDIFPKLDLSLPEGEWIEIAEFKSPYLSKKENNLDPSKRNYKRTYPNLFSSVLPYQNQMRYSVLKSLKNGGDKFLKIHPTIK